MKNRKEKGILPAGEHQADTDWLALTRHAIEDLAQVDEIYRPTNFWGPSVWNLLKEMEEKGVSTFKSWKTCSMFYPLYGANFTSKTISQVAELALEINYKATKPYVAGRLSGGIDARRDFDVLRLAWDQSRWPFKIEEFGESAIGSPRQKFSFTGEDGVFWTKPYLNYMLILAGLSKHVNTPPKRFLEIGGGFGVLGEIVMSRDPSAVYVDFDIPPLFTVAAFYLTKLFGNKRVALPITESIPSSGRFCHKDSGVFQNWRINDIDADFDVFVNSYSFQEMEPNVVEHYAQAVASKNVEFILSLNSKKGKMKASENAGKGVLEPVTSSFIRSTFEKLGYSTIDVLTDRWLST